MSKIAKQLLSVVHSTVAIAIERQPSIITVGGRPRKSFGKAVAEQDDFRLLSQGIKNITVVTYDELLMRLKNYIAVLEEFANKGQTDND